MTAVSKSKSHPLAPTGAPTISDEMLDEVAAASGPPTVALIQLCRRDRATAIKFAADLIGSVRWLQHLGDTPSAVLTTSERLAQLGRIEEIAADIEDLLLLIAENREAMEEFLRTCSDTELFAKIGPAVQGLDMGKAKR